MSAPNVQQHPASVDAYIRHGWSLVPIPHGTKGPRTVGWNRRENCIRDQSQLPPGSGIGLAHAYSGTMALDIDDWDTAAGILGPLGIDLSGLYGAPDAVIIDSGRQGHGKLLYSMPFGLALPSKKITRDGHAVYDLRCATANGLTVQDVLPPSMHPVTGQPYRWAGLGHWTRPPLIPDALLDHWRGLLAHEQVKALDAGTGQSVSWQEVQQALEHISPDCSRDDWIMVGMALQWAGTQCGEVDQALTLWDEWSRGSSTKYPGDRDILTQWRSFRPDKVNAVTLGSMFRLARHSGWTDDVTALFSAVRITLTPQQLIQGIRIAPPDMDMSLWPAVLANRAAEIADGIGCDPLVPLWAGLGAICGVANAEIRLELMPNFKVPPVLWLMTVGAPADKKSPGSSPMLEILNRIEIEEIPRFNQEILAWEGKEAAYAAAKKGFLEWSASPDAMLGGAAPPVPDLPLPPVPVKLKITDITSQKMVRDAASRPHGMLCHLDEMASWVKKLTDARSGEDRSAWVQAYEAKPYRMDRVGAGTIHCDNLAVAICGNIQPKVLNHYLAGMTVDGMIQRFIPAILRDDQTKLGHPKPDYLTTVTTWENTLRTIYALPTQTYRLSEPAYYAYREFQEWYELRKADERLCQSDDDFMTAFGKLEGTVGRLILVLHLVESPFSPVVDHSIVERAVRLAKTYIVPALRYIFAEHGNTDSLDRWLSDHIIHIADRGRVTLSELKRSARRQVEGMNAWEADNRILARMDQIEAAGWARRTDDRSREHQHHAEWVINPALITMFSDYRGRVSTAKKRIAAGGGPAALAEMTEFLNQSWNT